MRHVRAVSRVPGDVTSGSAGVLQAFLGLVGPREDKWMVIDLEE